MQIERMKTPGRDVRRVPSKLRMIRNLITVHILKEAGVRLDL